MFELYIDLQVSSFNLMFLFIHSGKITPLENILAKKKKDYTVVI